MEYKRPPQGKKVKYATRILFHHQASSHAPPLQAGISWQILPSQVIENKNGIYLARSQAL